MLSVCFNIFLCFENHFLCTVLYIAFKFNGKIYSLIFHSGHSFIY